MHKHNLAEISNALEKFSSHGLEDLSKAALMDRVDSKFIIPRDKLAATLERVSDYYSVLQIEDKRIFRYENIYYDTGDLDFYHSHHNGKLNRYKVRYRNYVDSGSAYLEVKFKNNKKRTQKTRIKIDESPSLAIKRSQDFLNNCGLDNATTLLPVQNGGYHRVALANEAAAERITIDIGVYFTDLASMDTGMDNRKPIGDFVIAELKQAKMNRKSPFYQLMRDQGFKKLSFSKYCMGMQFVHKGQLKANKFKATNLYINQL